MSSVELHEGKQPAPVATIDFEEFRERRKDPSVVVVNVLPRQTYAHSHIPGSTNLPLADIRFRAHEALPDKSQEIIVYCASFT